MKKSFLIGIAAAAMLASCSNDETVEMAQSKAISFSDAFVNKGTRSMEDPSFTKQTLGSFAVYGYSNDERIFNGDVVSSNDNGQSWTYESTKYWFEGHTYIFGAIAPAPANNSAVVVSDVSKSSDKICMTVDFTNDGMTDLLCAQPVHKPSISKEEATNAQPVNLTFNHQLSKVKFSFVNSVGGNYKIKVKNVTLEGTRQTGKLIINADGNAWSDQDSPNLNLSFGNAAVESATAEEFIENGKELETYYERLMIPTPASESTVYYVGFSVELYEGEGTTPIQTYNHSQVAIKNTELKLGYCYDFKAELTKDNIPEEGQLMPIVFSVNEIEEWKTEEQNQTLPGFEESTGN